MTCPSWPKKPHTTGATPGWKMREAYSQQKGGMLSSFGHKKTKGRKVGEHDGTYRCTT
jgi:hypothetical protein